MKIQSIGHRFLFGAALFTSVAGFASSASAHEAPCPYCNMPITQDTQTQDNEVSLKFGKKRIEYKCVFCAVAEANSEYKGDLSISAPSEKKGNPVVLKRTAGKWMTMPMTATFVMPTGKVKHRTCQTQARAFWTKSAAQTYAAKSGGHVTTLPELVASAK